MIFKKKIANKAFRIWMNLSTSLSWRNNYFLCGAHVRTGFDTGRFGTNILCILRDIYIFLKIWNICPNSLKFRGLQPSLTPGFCAYADREPKIALLPDIYFYLIGEKYFGSESPVWSGSYIRYDFINQPTDWPTPPKQMMVPPTVKNKQTNRQTAPRLKIKSRNENWYRC